MRPAAHGSRRHAEPSPSLYTYTDVYICNVYVSRLFHTSLRFSSVSDSCHLRAAKAGGAQSVSDASPGVPEKQFGFGGVVPLLCVAECTLSAHIECRH